MRVWCEGKDVRDGKSPREVIKELSCNNNAGMGQEEELDEAVMMGRGQVRAGRCWI